MANHKPIAVSIPEAVKLAGLSRTTIYELMKDGRLPICKVGTRTLIRLEALEALLRSLDAAAWAV